MRIKGGARNFIKKTADEAGLRALPGLFLVSIERRGVARSLHIRPSLLNTLSMSVSLLRLLIPAVCLFLPPHHCTEPRAHVCTSG